MKYWDLFVLDSKSPTLSIFLQPRALNEFITPCMALSLLHPASEKSGLENTTGMPSVFSYVEGLFRHTNTHMVFSSPRKLFIKMCYGRYFMLWFTAYLWRHSHFYTRDFHVLFRNSFSLRKEFTDTHFIYGELFTYPCFILDLVKESAPNTWFWTGKVESFRSIQNLVTVLQVRPEKTVISGSTSWGFLRGDLLWFIRTGFIYSGSSCRCPEKCDVVLPGGETEAANARLYHGDSLRTYIIWKRRTM